MAPLVTGIHDIRPFASLATAPSVPIHNAPVASPYNPDTLTPRIACHTATVLPRERAKELSPSLFPTQTVPSGVVVTAPPLPMKP